MASPLQHGQHEGESERSADETPALGTGAYVKSFGALVVLTVLSYWLSYRNLGAFGIPVALGIAALKVTIVALFFMGLIEQPASHRIAGLTAVLFVVLLASLAAADVVTRF